MADSPLIAGMVPASGGAAGSPAAPAAPSTSALIVGMKPASAGTTSPLVSSMASAINFKQPPPLIGNVVPLAGVTTTPVMPQTSTPKDTSNVLSKFLGWTGNAIGSVGKTVGDAIERTITPPTQNQLPDGGKNVNLNTLSYLPSELARQVPGVADLQDSTDIKATAADPSKLLPYIQTRGQQLTAAKAQLDAAFKTVDDTNQASVNAFNAQIDQYNASVDSYTKNLALYNDAADKYSQQTPPDGVTKVSLSDFTNAIPTAVWDTATGFLKAPIVAGTDLWDAARSFVGKNPDVSFDIPVLGKITSDQVNAVNAIQQGEDPVSAALSAGGTSIFNTLFFADVVNRIAGPRSLTVSKVTGPNINDYTTSNGTGPRPVIDTGPKTGRLYEPPTAYSRGGAQVLPKGVLDNLGFKMGSAYDPQQPVFFKITGGKGGALTGEVIQIKPSYLRTAYNNLFGGGGAEAPASVPQLLGQAPDLPTRNLITVVTGAAASDVNVLHSQTINISDVKQGLNDTMTGKTGATISPPKLPKLSAPIVIPPSHTVAHNLLRLGGGDTSQASAGAKVLQGDIKASLLEHGEMVTHQALIDKLGVDSQMANRLITDAKLAKTPAEQAALKNQVLSNIITPEGQPLKDVDLKQPTRLSAEQASPLAAKAAAHYYIAKIAPAIKEGRMVNLNADDLKKYFGEDYNDNNHPIYSQATIQIAARALKENKDSGVIMLGGGPGSGKSEILAKHLEEEGFKGIVYDSNLSNPEGARKFMQMARDAGKHIKIVGMIPNLDKARGFTLQREEATKRGITDNTFGNGHHGFPDTTRQLLESGDIKEEDVHLLDTRNFSGSIKEAKAIAKNGGFMESPLATLQNLGYDKEEIKKLYAKENYTKQADGTYSRQNNAELQDSEVRQKGNGSSSSYRTNFQRGFVAPGKVAEDIAAGVQQLKDIIEHHQKIEVLSTGMSNNLYKNEGADAALQVRMAQLANAARKLSTVEEREHVFHYMEDRNYPLTDKEREVVLPLVQEMDTTLDKLSHQAKELGAYIPGFIQQERIPRHIVDKDGVVDRALKSFEEGKKFIQSGGKLTTSVGSASKHRVYHTLTDEETGEKTLGAIKDKKVTQIVKGKSKDLGTLKLQKNEDLLNNQIRPLQRQITSMQTEIATLESVKAGSTGIEGKLAEIERKALSLSVSFLDTPDIRDDITIKKDTTKLRALMHDINLLSKVKDGEDIILRDQRIETLQGKVIEASNAMADIEQHFNPNSLDKKVHVAPDGKRYVISQATSLQIEANTKDRVYKDPLMAYGLAITRTASVVRNLEFLNKLKETEQYKDAILKEGETDMPDNYRPFKSLAMRGYWGELRVVEAFDDMAARAGEGTQDLGLLSDIYQKLNNFLVETIVLNPLMHFPNLAVNRGSELFAAGALPDVHFLDTLKQVLSKDDEYLTWVEHGAPFQYLRQSNSEYTDAMMEDIVKEAQKNASEIAPIDKVLGWTGKPFHWLAQVSSDATWVGNDVMLFNALKTYQKATGASYEKTIEEVTKRMADYRIPSRILGSRLIAKVVQSKNFFIFGAYHFSGVLKPWITSLDDGFTPFGEEKGGANAQQRYAAYRTLAYFGLLYLVYQLTDEMLQKETGNSNTYTSMAGPMRLPQNIGKSIIQKSPVPIISSLLTLNPAINIVGSIMTGYDFSNFFKPVFGPGGEGVTAVLANQASIYQGVSGAFQGTGSWTDYALTFGGVYTPKTTQQNSLVNSMLNIEKPQVEANMKADIANGDTAGAEALAKDFNDRLKSALSDSLKSIGKSGDDAQVQYYLTQFPNGLGAKGYAVRMPSATSMANYEAKMGFSSQQKLYGASAGGGANKGIPSSATNTTNPGSVNFVSPNGVTLYNRMSNESAVKAALSGGKIQPNTQLDHIVALEGGGTNEVTNIQIIPTAMDNVNQPVEDFIGQQVKAGTMDLAQSTEISIRFKAGLGQPLTAALQAQYHDKYGSQPLTLTQVYDYANTLISK